MVLVSIEVGSCKPEYSMIIRNWCCFVNTQLTSYPLYWRPVTDMLDVSVTPIGEGRHHTVEMGLHNREPTQRQGMVEVLAASLGLDRARFLCQGLQAIRCLQHRLASDVSGG